MKTDLSPEGKAPRDDSRTILSNEEVGLIEGVVSERHPSIYWEVRPIYGYGVSLVGVGPDKLSTAQMKLCDKGGANMKSLDEIIEWSDMAAMIVTDEDLSRDIIGEAQLHDEDS